MDIINKERKYKLKYIQDVGWILETDETDFKCYNCGDSIRIPMMFCKQTDKFYCKECNKKILPCESIDSKEHTHYNIINIKIIER